MGGGREEERRVGRKGTKKSPSTFLQLLAKELEGDLVDKSTDFQWTQLWVPTLIWQLTTTWTPALLSGPCGFCPRVVQEHMQAKQSHVKIKIVKNKIRLLTVWPDSEGRNKIRMKMRREQYL